jgi:glycosyltransferase involved in cell wall biosynthesis
MVHFQEIMELVDIFIAPSCFLRDVFIRSGIPPEKIVVLTNGIRRMSVPASRGGDRTRKLTFGFLGTLLPSKGLHLLIKAFRKLPLGLAQLNIYGKLTVYKGFESYLGYIRRLARRDDIHLMGEYAHEDIAKVLSEVDVLIVPSVWYENAPLVIQEGIMAGLPIIAADIGGIPEMVMHGENGLLFTAGDVDDLCAKMRMCIEDPAILARLKPQGAMIKSIEQNAQELELIYEGLIKQT